MFDVKKIIFVFFLLIGCSFSSFRDMGYQYLFPKPDAVHVSKHSTIIMRFDEIAPTHITNLSSFLKVRDEENREYTGRTKIASDGNTVIFEPDTPFAPGERVSVTVSPRFSAKNVHVKNLNYQFTVSVGENYTDIALTKDEQEKHCALQKSVSKTNLQSTARIMPNGVSVPSDFPHIEVFINENPSDGYLFLNNWGGQSYNLILESDGSPIWYMKTPDRRRDFKVQKNGNLTMLVRTGYPFGEGFIELDHNYTVVDSFHAVNGYATDEHGMQLLEDGHYLLIGRRTETVDMSKYVDGGQKNATVRECCIQEFTPEHELIFEWRAWDNFDIRDTYVPGENDLTSGYIRFPHMNSIDIDDDGNIVLSSRHLSEATKIDRETGEIIWRLSGENNDFEFINDPLHGFENQHSVRALGNNHYTVFDNGNEHDPPVSRALEYEIDTENLTAELVWSFRDNPDKYSHWMGNVQRLPNGNTHINWADGSLPKSTEVTPDGEKVYEMNFVQRYHSYRVFRFPWNGMALQPNLFVEPKYNNITLIFNKFGDPDVDYYNIYGGTQRHPTTVIDTSKATLKELTGLENGHRYYFRVTAVNKDGTESAFSEEKDIMVNFVEPGDNMMINGDFSQHKNNWTWEVRGSARAEWIIEDGVSHFDIERGGDNIWEVQLRQNGYTLIEGERYLFEFDAWADASRVAEIKVAQDHGPWINYSKIGLTALGRRKKHYSYEFLMEEPTDANSRVVINTGTDNADVYIDNITLKMMNDTRVEKQDSAPRKYALKRNYPNPFNPVTTIPFDVPEKSHVKISIYNLLGKKIADLVNAEFNAGSHAIQLSRIDLSSGLYFYRMQARSTNSSRTFDKIQKLTVLK